MKWCLLERVRPDFSSCLDRDSDAARPLYCLYVTLSKVDTFLITDNSANLWTMTKTSKHTLFYLLLQKWCFGDFMYNMNIHVWLNNILSILISKLISCNVNVFTVCRSCNWFLCYIFLTAYLIFYCLVK